MTIKLKHNIAIVIASPLIYALIVPLAILDLCVSVYQRICLPLFGQNVVKRNEYMVFDRQRLAYLSPFQKLNCVYCAYGNGVLALASEVAARTEEYWCPIKHDRSAKSTHERYTNFANYGDAAGFQAKHEKAREFDTWVETRSPISRQVLLI